MFNTARGRKKAHNLESDPRVGVTEGADAHIDSMAKKYVGVDTYPVRREGEVRICVMVRTDHIAMHG